MRDIDLRCSVLSAGRAEPMAGTAFNRGGLLLVEQPGAWGRGGLEDSDFNTDVALALHERAGAADLKVLAIRHPGRTAAGAQRRWAVRPPGSPVTVWGTYDDDAELLDLPLDGSAGDADPEPTYLVCTHAKRDECCAVFGRRIESALHWLRPDRVWGCSHTGGHRFAPVVLAIPSGVAGAALYGRVEEVDLVPLVEATEAGESVPRLLRGLIGHTPAVQAAIAEAQAQTGVLGLGDWAVAEVLGFDTPPSAATQPAMASVRLDATTAGLAVEVDLQITRDETPYPSCSKPGPDEQEHVVVTGFRIRDSR